MHPTSTRFILGLNEVRPFTRFILGLIDSPGVIPS